MNSGILNIGDITFSGYAECDIHAVRFQAAFTDILAYFRKRTGDARLPRRSDVIPRDLQVYLPRVFIWDIVRDAQGRVEDTSSRLMGTGLSSFYGEFTGSSNFTYAQSQVSDRIRWAVGMLDQCRQPFAYQAMGELEDGQETVLSVLLIPLSNDGHAIDQCFGMLDLALPDAPAGYLVTRGLVNPLAAPMTSGVPGSFQKQMSANLRTLINYR